MPSLFLKTAENPRAEKQGMTTNFFRFVLEYELNVDVSEDEHVINEVNVLVKFLC